MKRSSYDALASLLVRHYQKPEALAGLMDELGYGDVTEWVRPGPAEVYARQLLMGLQRRGLLDQSFVQRLARALPPDEAPQLWSVAEELGVPPPAPQDSRHERTLPVREEGEKEPPPSFLGSFFGFFKRSEGPSVESSIRYQDSLSSGGLEALLAAGRSVGRVRIGRGGGPPRPESTGFLVAADLLAVPDFVVLDPKLVSRLMEAPDLPRPAAEDLDLVAIVDFGYGLSSQAGALDLPTGVECSGVAALDWQAGFALLRLRDPVEVPPLRLSTDLPTRGDRLHLIHHPQGGPQRFAVYGCQVHESDGDQLQYLGPTTGGSSGAPLLDGSLGVLAMAYGRGEQGVRVGPSARAILDGLRERHRPLWQEIRSAQPQLKTIDPRLDGVLAEAERRGSGRVPMVIHLATDGERLTDIPELEVSSHAGSVVTATGSRETYNALRVDPRVAGIEASIEGGMLECAEALDIVGVPAVHSPPDGFGERGDHALIAIIDNGIDVLHPAFTVDATKSRIVALWDQLHPGNGGTAAACSPAGHEEVERLELGYGKLYTAADLDGFVAQQAVSGDFPAAEDVVHGTLVASIAAGSTVGGGGEDFGGGVAPEAKLLIVRYDREDSSIGYSVGHIDALRFIAQVAADLDLPVVVNISNGMNAGAHDGTSSVEKACDGFVLEPGRAIVKSAGNEGQVRRHVQITVPQGSQRKIQWRTADEDGNDILEFWFPSKNEYQFTLVAPGGAGKARADKDQPYFSELIGADQLVEMSLQPYVVDNGDARLTLSVYPIGGGRVSRGDWRLGVRGLAVAKNRPIDGWIEVSRRHTRFLSDTTDDITITIPGTARSVLCVGAATKDREFIEVYDRSSRGPTRSGAEKPDLVAPGVEIRAAQAGMPNGMSQPKSGTSFAAPQVAGAVALKLSEWRRSHPDPAARPPLSGEQIRNAILDHSHPGDGNWDNLQGWGRLDVRKFFAVKIP